MSLNNKRRKEKQFSRSFFIFFFLGETSRYPLVSKAEAKKWPLLIQKVKKSAGFAGISFLGIWRRNASGVDFTSETETRPLMLIHFPWLHILHLSSPDFSSVAPSIEKRDANNQTGKLIYRLLDFVNFPGNWITPWNSISANKHGKIDNFSGVHRKALWLMARNDSL